MCWHWTAGQPDLVHIAGYARIFALWLSIFTRILFNPQSYDTLPTAYFEVCSDHTWPARTKTMPPSDIFWGIRDISGHSQVVVFQIENISWRGAKRFLCWYAEDKLGLQILKMNTRLSFSSPGLQVKLCMLMQGILDGCTLARIHWHPMSGLGWSEVGSVRRVAFSGQYRQVQYQYMHMLKFVLHFVLRLKPKICWYFCSKHQKQ